MSRSEQARTVARSSSTLGAIASRLVGVWTLVGYADEQEGHEDSFPFGPAPTGFLIYTSDGFVSAQLMKPGRSLLQSHDWYGGTSEEYRKAASGYIAYCGMYEVNEESKTVTHIPFVALLPNLVDQEQLRSVTLRGERLTLRAAVGPVENGVAVTSRLEWRRAEG